MSDNKCIKCGFEINNDAISKCPKCGAIQTENSSGFNEKLPGSAEAFLLKCSAWFYVVISVIGGISIFNVFGTTQVRAGTYYKYTHTVSNPVGKAIGIATMLQGIFIFILLLVIAAMAENIIEIRKNTAT